MEGKAKYINNGKSRPVPPLDLGCDLSSLLAAWFPGGATLFHPYPRCPRPVRRECVLRMLVR